MFREARLESGSLHLRDQGEGPVIIFLHGFPLDHTMWAHQIEFFSSRYRVLAPDLRGFGRSTLPVTEMTTMQQFADDIAEALIQLNVTEIVLCGLSMGGYIAWPFLKNYQGRLMALILCDTRSSADAPTVARARQLMAQQVVHRGVRDSLAGMLEKLFARVTLEKNPSITQSTHEIMISTRPESIAAAQRGMAARPDMTSMLGKIQVPTLVLCGEHDSITTCDEMREMSHKIANAQFALIPQAGHMAPLENPAATNTAIQSFLDCVHGPDTRQA